MTALNTIDRPALRHIQEQFHKELKDVADRLGIDISPGSGTYGGTTGSIKINLSVRDTGMGVSGKQLEFERHARAHGIAGDALGKSFVFDKRKPWMTYEVCGVNPKSPKYRFNAKRNDGRVFKFTPEVLRQHFPA